MAQIPILSGIYGKGVDVHRSVPVNMIPVAEPGDGSGTGISKGYLRLTAGLRTIAKVTGVDRGAYVWLGSQYRVRGATLLRLDGNTITSIGDVGSDGKPVTFAEGFGRIAIASAGKLYYYDGSALTQMTDADLGTALSVAWSDGYYLTTDGTSIVATDLNDPASIDPLKYGSSEADPDPVQAILALRGEVYALNRYTIEKFINAGTTGFPFQRSRGSQIPKGCVGSKAFTPFVETFAFCGSARNETAAIHLAGAGQAIRISPRVMDDALAALTDEQLALVELEALNSAGLYQLLVHLPTETWVYHWTASQLLDLPVWSRLAGGAMLDEAYPGRHFVLSDGQWWCGGVDTIGVVDDKHASFFGKPLAYQFDTPLIYNGGNGAITNEAELVTIGARGADASQVAMSYTGDGLTWSQERFKQVGGGAKRTVWRRLGRMANWRGYRFRGVAKAPLAFSRLEVDLEPLV